MRKKQRLSEMPASTNSIVGNVNVIKCNAQCNIQWTIDHFCDTCWDWADLFLSPIFSMNYNNEVANFQMLLGSKTSKDTSEEYISIYLRNQSIFDVTCQLEFSILNNKNKNVNKKRDSQYVTFRPGGEWGFPEFAKLNFVVDDQNGISDNEPLVISCFLKATNASTSIDEERIENDKGVQAENEIKNDDLLVRLATLNDFETMYIDGTFSDVIISTGNGKDFHLHKCVLASRSPVFQAMFNSDIIESEKNLIIIEDFSCEIMEELFRFMYTGKVEQIEKVADGLFKAAHKYCIEDLMALCEKTLCKILTLDNVLEYLVLADLYCAKYLKTEAIQYIVSHGKNIVEKPEFKTSVNVETACEIISAIFANNET